MFGIKRHKGLKLVSNVGQGLFISVSVATAGIDQSFGYLTTQHVLLNQFVHGPPVFEPTALACSELKNIVLDICVHKVISIA